MKPFLSLFFPALLIVVPFHLLSGQCLVSPGPLAQRVQQATIVIEGEVIAKRSFWDTAKGLIYTENTIAPFMQFKGRTSAPVYQLITHGGVVGNRAIRVSPSLQLEVGTIGVFLLKEYPIALADADPSALRPISVNGAAFLHSPDHHHIQSDVDGVFEREVFYEQMSQLTGQEPKLIRSMRIPRQNGRMTPSITSFTPTTETAGTGDQITITGTNFGATAGTVFFSNADDGGATFVSAAAAQIVSWADTEIDVVVPSGAGTGPIIVQDASATNSPASATNLIITYNISNILREEGRLIDDAGDANGG
ncbi:MAG: IPT/TIG domain-containing protein, partial [Bacteroidota bacterium]